MLAAITAKDSSAGPPPVHPCDCFLFYYIPLVIVGQEHPRWEVMAVDVTTTPTFQAGTSKLLFKLPGPLAGNPAQWKNVSPDGQRFVLAMLAAATAPR